MRFLADMGISQRVVDYLRSLGHDVVHLRDQGLQRLPNGEIFTKGTAEKRVVMAFDLDFGEIVASSGGTSSVILFRRNITRSEFVIAPLNRVLPDVADALEAGAIVVIEDGRHRIRRLPIGG